MQYVYIYIHWHVYMCIYIRVCIYIHMYTYIQYTLAIFGASVVTVITMLHICLSTGSTGFKSFCFTLICPGPNCSIYMCQVQIAPLLFVPGRLVFSSTPSTLHIKCPQQAGLVPEHEWHSDIILCKYVQMCRHS